MSINNIEICRDNAVLACKLIIQDLDNALDLLKTESGIDQEKLISKISQTRKLYQNFKDKDLSKI